MHEVIETMCGGNPPRFQHYSRVWDVSEWKDVTKALDWAIKKFVGKGMEKEQVYMLTYPVI